MSNIVKGKEMDIKGKCSGSPFEASLNFGPYIKYILLLYVFPLGCFNRNSGCPSIPLASLTLQSFMICAMYIPGLPDASILAYLAVAR